MSEILFKMAAKTNVGLERQNNEDNFQVSANLDTMPMQWVNNQQYSLGKRGALMVVADGMGGMNAGEVASQIAIDTVRSYFTPEHITDEVVKSRFTIEKFMKDVIVAADQHIKDYAKAYPESRSMGTTIVMAWLFDGSLYVTWVGDSRAYIYNQNTGLFQISKDHSYVQELVDEGKITEEDAFDYPDSNIITRSLSDATSRVQPECLLSPQKLCNGDIILLCSDGLSGMIRDKEIEQIIAQTQTDMTQCVDTLIQAALDAGGADNCTVAVSQIMAGAAQSDPSRVLTKKQSKQQKSAVVNGNTSSVAADKGADTDKWKKLILPLLALLVVACGCLVFILKPWEKDNDDPKGETSVTKEDAKVRKDSLAIVDFKATQMKDEIAFVMKICNMGDSLGAGDYSIVVTCNSEEQNLSGLDLESIPAGKEVTFKASASAPQEKGNYTYAVTIKTTERYTSPAATATINIKGNEIPKAIVDKITSAEYRSNKNDFEEKKITITWTKEKTYKDLLVSVEKENKIDLQLLKELNKNGYPDTARVPGNRDGTIINLIIVKKKDPKNKK